MRLVVQARLVRCRVNASEAGPTLARVTTDIS
jgi:hypothetical protein